MNEFDEPRLSAPEAARFLQVSESTLSRWRAEGIGPKYLQLEGHAQYPASWLREYLRASIRETTTKD